MAENASPKRDDDTIELSPTVIIGVVLALIAVTVLVFTVFGGDDGDGEEPQTSTPAPGDGGTPSTPESGPTTTTTTRPKEVTGLPPGEPTDDFDRADSEEVGGGWQAIGTWGIEGGELVNVVNGGETSDEREFVLRDAGAPDLTLAAVVRYAAEGSGIVFRYQDPDNYLELSPAPRWGIWGLRRIENGVATVVGPTELASSAPNTSVVIQMLGPDIIVSVDGEQVGRFSEEAFTDASQVGFATGGYGSQRARWDDVFVIPVG